MCGYVITPRKPNEKEIKFLFHRQRHRGEDGFGCIHLPTGRFVKALKLKDFLRKFRSMPKDGSYLFHHRKASVGGITEDLVHPQKCRDKVGSVTFLVTQNGTKKALAQAFGTESDTVAITRTFPMLEQYSNENLIDDFLLGAGLVFVYKHHEKRPNELLMWHDGERTLFECVDGQLKGVFSSEPLDKGKWREVLPLDTMTPMPLDVGKWSAKFEEMNAFGDIEEYVMNEAYSDDRTSGGVRETRFRHGQWVAFTRQASPCRKRFQAKTKTAEYFPPVTTCGAVHDGTTYPVGAGVPASTFDEDVDALVPFWDEVFREQLKRKKTKSKR